MAAGRLTIPAGSPEHRRVDKEPTMSELWAYCDPCGRWFYPDADSGGGTPPCPVCSTEAVLLAEEPDDVRSDAGRP